MLVARLAGESVILDFVIVGWAAICLCGGLTMRQAKLRRERRARELAAHVRRTLEGW